jgi:hypothetical protein
MLYQEDYNLYQHFNELKWLQTNIMNHVELKENDLKNGFVVAISIIEHLLSKIEKVDAIQKDHEECYFCKLSK